MSIHPHPVLQVPATGIGKAITIVWMLFGILNFGIFTGQISSQINLISAESAIMGALISQQHSRPRACTHNTANKSEDQCIGLC